jgi:hypothetical protein
LDLAYAFAATQVTACMAHEQSLHGGVPRAAVAGAAVGEAGYTWLALATVLTWLPKRAVRHDLAASAPLSR